MRTKETWTYKEVSPGSGLFHVTADDGSNTRTVAIVLVESDARAMIHGRACCEAVEEIDAILADLTSANATPGADA